MKYLDGRKNRKICSVNCLSLQVSIREDIECECMAYGLSGSLTFNIYSVADSRKVVNNFLCNSNHYGSSVETEEVIDFVYFNQ